MIRTEIVTTYKSPDVVFEVDVTTTDTLITVTPGRVVLPAASCTLTAATEHSCLPKTDPYTLKGYLAKNSLGEGVVVIQELAPGDSVIDIEKAGFALVEHLFIAYIPPSGEGKLLVYKAVGGADVAV